MKLIILEGGDRLGKSTLIKGLCEHFKYDNVTIRHFGKPPEGMLPEDVLDFQFSAFHHELEIYLYMDLQGRSRYKYYPEKMIWNRSHLGEYVYSQMFRKGNPKVLKGKLLDYERHFVNDNVYLITLTADPDFFNERKCDGHELSKTIEQKTKELELFKEAHEFSVIPNKLLLKVDKEHGIPTGSGWIMKGPNVFRTKEDILDEVLQFINEKQ
jgi:thymidylate kinase